LRKAKAAADAEKKAAQVRALERRIEDLRQAKQSAENRLAGTERWLRNRRQEALRYAEQLQRATEEYVSLTDNSSSQVYDNWDWE
jgi:chromosome segregation ATPase